MSCTIIGIAGGTGSGKSTFTDRIKVRFGNAVTVIYHDNYYKRHDDMTYEERCMLNYDVPDALDTDLLVEHIRMLKRGETIQCPVYDFAQHNRSDDHVEIKPSRIVIVEGILVLYDERLRDLFDIKIFVDADADERILRRAKRDMMKRGRSLESVMDQYMKTVKPMHYYYVEPTKRSADIVLNSGRNEAALEVMSAMIEKILK